MYTILVIPEDAPLVFGHYAVGQFADAHAACTWAKAEQDRNPLLRHQDWVIVSLIAGRSSASDGIASADNKP